jgi:hypothetical protein
MAGELSASIAAPARLIGLRTVALGLLLGGLLGQPGARLG